MGAGKTVPVIKRDFPFPGPQKTDGRLRKDWIFNSVLYISFADVWIRNRDRNQNMALRNVDDLFVPPHRIELIKNCLFVRFRQPGTQLPI